MQKSKSVKPAAKVSPDRLTKVDRKVGVELTESQLGQAVAGAQKVKIEF